MSQRRSVFHGLDQGGYQGPDRPAFIAPSQILQGLFPTGQDLQLMGNDRELFCELWRRQAQLFCDPLHRWIQAKPRFSTDHHKI